MKLVWSISPSYFFMLIFNSLIFTGQILLNVILPKYLIDELTGNRDYNMLIFWVVAIVANNLIFSF